LLALATSQHSLFMPQQGSVQFDGHIKFDSFLKRIRTHELYRQIQQLQNHRPTGVDDYVREEKIQFNSESSFVGEIFKQRRPLKPERQLRPQIQAGKPSECKIVAQVWRAYNIPVRKVDRSSKGLSISDKSEKAVSSAVVCRLSSTITHGAVCIDRAIIRRISVSATKRKDFCFGRPKSAVERNTVSPVSTAEQ
jgi:hypothetical protein